MIMVIVWTVLSMLAVGGLIFGVVGALHRLIPPQDRTLVYVTATVLTMFGGPLLLFYISAAGSFCDSGSPC